MRKALSEDIPRLVALMVEFYAEAGYPLNQQRAAEAFTTLVHDERLGQVWLIEARPETAVQSETASGPETAPGPGGETGGETRAGARPEAVGYIVVTLGYSMEYGGRDAFVDDLFLAAAHRGRGLGTAALAQARAYCVAQGVRGSSRSGARQRPGSSRVPPGGVCRQRPPASDAAACRSHARWLALFRAAMEPALGASKLSGAERSPGPPERIGIC
jgi:GNAT superfamily N-acetyltransferase